MFLQSQNYTIFRCFSELDLLNCSYNLWRCRHKPTSNEEASCVRNTYSRPEPRGWGSVFPGLTRAVPHDFAVDGAADTIVQLHVQLGQNVGCEVQKMLKWEPAPKHGQLIQGGATAETLTVEDAGLRDVPHCRSLHNVPDDKLLDGLVLWDTAGTVGAADGLHMSTALLGATIIPPFLGLLKYIPKTSETG